MFESNMGIFSTSSPFDQRIERATSEKNTEDDWGQIMIICDKIRESPTGPADALKSITKRLHHDIPRVVLQTITLLDACVNNCGKKFLLKVAERDFEQELQKILTNPRAHHKVSEKLRECLKKWAEGEFKGDSELSLIPALYSKLHRLGYDFTVQEDSPKKTVKYSDDPNVVNTQQEEDDIARAIQLSLQGPSSSNKSSGIKPDVTSTSLYSSAAATLASSAPIATEPEKEPKKVRALYDFEAAEDNELTFKAGEIILVIDHSDANWWKGNNHRGEGLFPANFVTEDLSEELESSRNEGGSSKRVSFSECVEVTEVSQNEPPLAAQGISNDVTGDIDEGKIDQLLHLLHEADPTGERSDDPSLSLLEGHVNAMAPTIDAELEQIDRKHAQLARISTDLVGALNLYQQLMREMPPAAMPYYQPYPKGIPGGPPGVPMPIPGATGMMPPQYIPQGGSPSMAQMYPPGQYPTYGHPAGMPAPSYMAHAPQMHPAMQQQQQPPPPQGAFSPQHQMDNNVHSQVPASEYPQMPAPSQVNLYPGGHMPAYGAPSMGEVPPIPNSQGQNQMPPTMQQPPSVTMATMAQHDPTGMMPPSGVPYMPQAIQQQQQQQQPLL